MLNEHTLNQLRTLRLDGMVVAIKGAATGAEIWTGHRGFAAVLLRCPVIGSRELN